MLKSSCRVRESVYREENKVMSLLKKALLLLAVAFALDGILVFAATQKAYFSVSIEPGKSILSNYKTKDTYSKQTYKNTFTNTVLTSPCPNCVIAVKFEKSDGSSTERAVLMNQEITCNVTGLWQPGKYRIRLRRSDPTALTTYTSGEWSY